MGKKIIETGKGHKEEQETQKMKGKMVGLMGKETLNRT